MQQPVVIEQVPTESEKQNGQRPVPFISTHYTGTAYMRPDTTSEPSRSPPPPYHEALMPEAMYETLRQHSIDPSALLPNQIHLFQNADNEQRMRLLELWRIAPPSYPLEDHMNGTWSSTTVEREEALARERYEQQQQMESRRYTKEHMLDTHVPRDDWNTYDAEPISPIREAGEPAWPPAARMRVSSIANSRPMTRQGEPEPYIVSGYADGQMPPGAIDPVYAAARNLWQAPTYAQVIGAQGTMADQYGMYEQIRNHADWERLNEQIAREKLSQGQNQAPAEDYDMEL